MGRKLKNMKSLATIKRASISASSSATRADSPTVTPTDDYMQALNGTLRDDVHAVARVNLGSITGTIRLFPVFFLHADMTTDSTG